MQSIVTEPACVIHLKNGHSFRVKLNEAAGVYISNERL